MAVTMSATCTITSPQPIVVNQPVTVQVAVTNSGTTATNVTGVQLIVNGAAFDSRTPAGASVEPAVNVIQPAIPVGSTVQTVSSSTLYFAGGFVYFSSVAQATAAVNSALSVYALVTTSDGSVTASLPIIASLATFIQSQPQVTPAIGQLSFDTVLNSALFPVFF